MVRPKRTKPDANQAEIVEDLRRLGFDVDIICNLPGLYDLVVSGKLLMPDLGGALYAGSGDWEMEASVRVEVKQPGQKLNDNEIEYWGKQRNKGSLIIAECTEDILRWFGRL